MQHAFPFLDFSQILPGSTWRNAHAKGERRPTNSKKKHCALSASGRWRRPAGHRASERAREGDYVPFFFFYFFFFPPSSLCSILPALQRKGERKPQRDTAN